MAATLACGDDAVLSHRSAAALWGCDSAPEPASTSPPLGVARSGQPGIDLHHVRALNPDDRGRVAARLIAEEPAEVANAIRLLLEPG
jgi:hypothetical protein